MYQKYITTKRIRDNFLPVGVFVLILVFWELTDHLFEIKEIILPSPSDIFGAVKENFRVLLKETWVTALESIMGLLLGSIFAFGAATWFVFSEISKKALYPYAIAIKATPLYALAPLLVLWLGNGMLSKVVMSALVAFFPVLVSSVAGLGSISKQEMDLMLSLRASVWQTYVKLRLPRSFSFVFPSLKISSTLAVVGAVIAEFTGSSRGIGHLIVNSSYYLETSLMFSGIIMAALLGIALFGCACLIEKKVVYWK